MSLIAASIFNFAVVVFILWFFGKKPMGAFLATRSELVATSMKEAEAQSKEAGAFLNEWESNWKSCENHAHRQLEEAKAAMTRFRETSLSAAKLESERVKKEAALVGKSEVARTKEMLRRELVDRSVLEAKQYLEGHMTDKDRHKLVNEYVEKVSNGSAG